MGDSTRWAVFPCKRGDKSSGSQSFRLRLSAGLVWLSALLSQLRALDETWHKLNMATVLTDMRVNTQDHAKCSVVRNQIRRSPLVKAPFEGHFARSANGRLSDCQPGVVGLDARRV